MHFQLTGSYRYVAVTFSLLDKILLNTVNIHYSEENIFSMPLEHSFPFGIFIWFSICNCNFECAVKCWFTKIPSVIRWLSRI